MCVLQEVSKCVCCCTTCLEYALHSCALHACVTDMRCITASLRFLYVLMGMWLLGQQHHVTGTTTTGQQHLTAERFFAYLTFIDCCSVHSCIAWPLPPFQDSKTQAAIYGSLGGALTLLLVIASIIAYKYRKRASAKRNADFKLNSVVEVGRLPTVVHHHNAASLTGQQLTVQQMQMMRPGEPMTP